MSKYAVSDLHGRYDIFQKIKEFIHPEDIVYVLGDCADRGKDGWQIIKEVYNNPQFIYIKGNHEDLLVKAMYGDKQLCYLNGGKVTYNTWKYKDGGSMAWARRLDYLPLEKTYINTKGQTIILCHAGYTPQPDQRISKEEYLWGRDHFNEKWNENYPTTFIIHGHTPIPYLVSNAEPGAYWYCNDKGGIAHKCDIDCGSVITNYAVLLDLDTFKQYLIGF